MTPAQNWLILGMTLGTGAFAYVCGWAKGFNEGRHDG